MGRRGRRRRRGRGQDGSRCTTIPIRNTTQQLYQEQQAVYVAPILAVPEVIVSEDGLVTIKIEGVGISIIFNTTSGQEAKQIFIPETKESYEGYLKQQEEFAGYYIRRSLNNLISVDQKAVIPTTLLTTSSNSVKSLGKDFF